MIYSDLKISSGDDLAVDEAGQAQIVTDRDCIIQDLIHAIRESGYLVEMVAELNPDKRKLLLQEIALLVEDDERIVPGTVTITENAPAVFGAPWSWDLIADTYDFKDITLKLGA
ncbi:MAG: DUF2590 family protein [Lentisphaerota bacterium]